MLGIITTAIRTTMRRIRPAGRVRVLVP